MFKIYRKLSFVILFIIFVFSSYKLFEYSVQSSSTQQVNMEARAIYKEENSEHNKLVGQAASSEKKQEVKKDNQLANLRKINADTVGWLTIKDTVIDYPVVQATDNEYYLHHDFNKKESKAGSIYMDFRNTADPLMEHTILYGHSMRDGSMFRSLLSYKDQGYLEKHPTIIFNSLDGNHTWEIFSVYVTSTEFYYIDTEFSSDEDYQSFLDKITKKSYFNRDIDPVTYKDKILTLSTCSYEFDDARMVVHARLLK